MYFEQEWDLLCQYLFRQSTIQDRFMHWILILFLIDFYIQETFGLVIYSIIDLAYY